MADPLETVTDSKVTGRWADEADAEAETQTAATTSEEAALDSLTIDATRKVNKEVSDPDDCRIEAVTAGDTIYASAKIFEFKDLNISQELEGLYGEMKFEKPGKMQAISLPMILTPPLKDLVAQARNGPGKTTRFVLDMLRRIDTKLTAPQALCICLTPELAIQNMEDLLRMEKFTGITSEVAFQDSPITAQVVIGTPGTISYLVTLNKLSMSFMKILVFDEADHMLAEGGFRDDSRKIMKTIVQSSSDCQVLLFSATFNNEVRAFVDQTIKDIFNKNQMFLEKEELSLASAEQYKDLSLDPDIWCQGGLCGSVDPSMADNTKYKTLEDQIKKLEDLMVEMGEIWARQNTEFQKQKLAISEQVSDLQIQINEMMRFLKMEKQPIEEETICLDTTSLPTPESTVKGNKEKRMMWKPSTGRNKKSIFVIIKKISRIYESSCC